MDGIVTVADLERQLGQMVVQLIAKDKLIEALERRIADLTPKPAPEGEQEQ